MSWVRTVDAPALAGSPAVTGRAWVLNLPFDKPMSLNDRVHWRARSRQVRAWRDGAHWLAKQAKIPRLQAFTVALHYRPPTRRRRDPENLVASLKAVVDGLVQAGVADDDDQTLYWSTMPVIDPPDALRPASLWLVVYELQHPLTPAVVR